MEIDVKRKVKPGNRADSESLIDRAATVRVLPFAESNREAYMAASESVLSDVERIVGRTGDVVTAALDRSIPVDIVRPPGAIRA